MKSVINHLIKNREFEMDQGTPMELEVFEWELKDIFKAYFGINYVEKNFSLTDDIKELIQLLDGNLRKSDWCAIYCGSDIITSTEYYCRQWGEQILKRRQQGELDNNDVMFMRLGYWSDKHDYIFCCDKSSLHYGKIYDVNDEHPWLEEYFNIEEEYENVMDFLRDIGSFM